jgi:hypothetical protein
LAAFYRASNGAIKAQASEAFGAICVRNCQRVMDVLEMILIGEAAEHQKKTRDQAVHDFL